MKTSLTINTGKVSNINSISLFSVVWNISQSKLTTILMSEDQGDGNMIWILWQNNINSTKTFNL